MTDSEAGERLLVLDASLNRRIASELKGRGRPAVTASELGMARLTDPELLRGLSRRIGPEEWVLVTADDFLPAEQEQLITELGAAVATVQGQGRARGVDEERFARETCHRWAHAMATQMRGSLRRYSPSSNRAWTPRLR